MKTTITATISYKTLKAMLPDATDLRTPKGETLIKSDREVLTKIREDSATIIIYKDGFFVYIDDLGHVTARAVANCHVMRFEKAEGGYDHVDEKDFEQMPFPVVLSHFGMENIADQLRKKTKRSENLSLDADEIPYHPNLAIPNFADELDLDGESDIWEKRLAMLPEAMEKLTERQREVVELFYFKKMTQDQIARELHINQSSVSRRLRNSIERMGRFFK